MNTQSSPTMTSRLLALILGPAYLHLVAHGLSLATKTSYTITLTLTVIGSLTVMVVLTVFGVRAYTYKHSNIRFTLSSALLVTIPFSIYLATLRWVFRDLPTRELDAASWLLISAFSLMFMILTTAMLLWLAEAIVWFAVASLRGLSAKRLPDGSAELRNK